MAGTIRVLDWRGSSTVHCLKTTALGPRVAREQVTAGGKNRALEFQLLGNAGVLPVEEPRPYCSRSRRLPVSINRLRGRNILQRRFA
jgi:hypothetical protein